MPGQEHPAERRLAGCTRRAYCRKDWHGYYWARRNEAGDYEIRSVPSSSGEPSVPGGVFPKEGFEEHYERVSQ